MAAVNTQGLNPMRIHHVDKLQSLLLLARRQKWDLTFLSDLHHDPFEFISSSGEAKSQPLVLMIEEYALVQWEKTGFLLSHAMWQTWFSHGKEWRRSGDRTFALQIPLCSQVTWWIAVYCPPSGDRALRQFFFLEAQALASTISSCDQWWGGDWNSHVGSDRSARYGLSTPTTSRSTEDFLP